MTKPMALCGAAIMLAALMLAAPMMVAPGAARADSPGGLDPIAVRQAGYALQGGDFAYIRSVVQAKGDVKPLEVPAKAIGKWGRVIPTLFPKGSETGENTKALPKIWSDPEGFQKIALALVQASDKLATDAKAGATDMVAADTKELGKQCGACHKAYRAK